MPRTSEMKEKKFVGQGDVNPPVLWTITGCEKHNVAKEGAEPEMKWCLMFHETDKPLTLNWTNIQVCERIFGSDDTDQWVGKQIVLYVDPNVSYGGKVTGGVRVRAVKKKQAAPPPPPADPDFDDTDVPF